MAQSQFLRYVKAVRHGQDAPCRSNPVVAYYHCTVVQRTVLEEYVLYQFRVDVGIDKLARLDDVGKRHVPFQYDERTDKILAHVVARHSHLQHGWVGGVDLLFLLEREQPHNQVKPSLRTEGEEEASDVFLEEDDKGQDTHADEFVEDGTHQSHLYDLRHNDPCHDKHQDAIEHVEASRCFHQLVYVIKQKRYAEYVDNIFYPEIK